MAKNNYMTLCTARDNNSKGQITDRRIPTKGGRINGFLCLHKPILLSMSCVPGKPKKCRRRDEEIIAKCNYVSIYS